MNVFKSIVIQALHPRPQHPALLPQSVGEWVPDDQGSHQAPWDPARGTGNGCREIEGTSLSEGKRTQPFIKCRHWGMVGLRCPKWGFPLKESKCLSHLLPQQLDFFLPTSSPGIGLWPLNLIEWNNKLGLNIYCEETDKHSLYPPRASVFVGAPLHIHDSV